MQTGVDISKIDRFKNLANNPKFLSKYFSPSEIKHISQKNFSTQTVAGLFCVKEAVLTTLNLGFGAGLDLKEISTNFLDSGKPFVEVTAKIDFYLQKIGCNSLAISISHDGEYAIAFCVAS